MMMQGKARDGGSFMYVVLGMIVFLVVGIVQFALYGDIQEQNDSLNLLFQDRCEISAGGDEGNRFLRLYLAMPGSSDPLGAPDGKGSSRLTESTCKGLKTGGTSNVDINVPDPLPGTLAVGWPIITEHGTRVGQVTDKEAPASGVLDKEHYKLDDKDSVKWATELRITQRFNGILRIVVGLLPLIGTIHFMGVGAANMLSMQGTTAGTMTMLIFESVITFLVIVLTIAFSPTFLTWMNEAYLHTLGGRLSIYDSVWGNITQIFWQFLPMLFVIGLVGIFGGTAARAYGRVREPVRRGIGYARGALRGGRRRRRRMA